MSIHCVDCYCTVCLGDDVGQTVNAQLQMKAQKIEATYHRLKCSGFYWFHRKCKYVADLSVIHIVQFLRVLLPCRMSLL